MSRKTVSFTRSGVEKLPDNKPVVYKIKTDGEKVNYIGSAERGRVRERLGEHLKNGVIPGSKVVIEQKSSIAEARDTESRSIAIIKPKYNKQGK